MPGTRNHSEVGSNFPTIAVNPNNVSSSLLRSLNTEHLIQFSDWEKIKVQEISNEIKKLCDKLIEKYWFSPNTGEKFKKSIFLHPFEEVPWHPTYRGISCSKVICTWDRASLSGLLPTCDIYVNPKMVDNRDFYFAVMFHELDHHAFYYKKFLDKNINNISSLEWKQNALNLFSYESTRDHNYSFCTELMARIDTADELMSRGISWDRIWKYWPGNEYETTWEDVYWDSIKYAKKFLHFQIWLYNLLWNTFWLDSNRLKKKHLSKTADKQFQTVMNRLRNEIFNSSSIERSKGVIDRSYWKLQESRWSWDIFCSLRK